MSRFVGLFVCLCSLVSAQAPIGTLEGQITDPAAAAIAGAEVKIP
ncbi:MAG: hypothetical protein WDO73_02155 [Ignavibacteriota bacterium]